MDLELVQALVGRVAPAQVRLEPLRLFRGRVALGLKLGYLPLAVCCDAG